MTSAARRGGGPRVGRGFWVLLLGVLGVIVGLAASCADPAQPVLDVTPSSVALVSGQTVQLAVTRHFSGGPMEVVTERVEYTTSSRSIALVNERGLVTAGNEAGSAIVRIKDPLSDAVTTTTFTVTVARITSIEIVPSPASTMRPGERRAFFATAHLATGQTKDVTGQVTWASSNEAVATVGKTPGDLGTVTAVTQGDVTISATDPATATQGRSIVFVRGDAAVLRAVVVSPNPATVAVGATQAFSALGIYGDGTSVDLTRSVGWSSTSTTVATIDGTGLARGVALGNTTVTASIAAGVPSASDAGAGDSGDGGSDGGAAALITGSSALRVQ